MIAMNDLKKQLEERREQLGSSEQMRRGSVADERIWSAGPGEKGCEIDRARGTSDKAEEPGQADLAEQDARRQNCRIREKEQLKKQVEQMKEALEQAVAEQHEQKKQELQEKIDTGAHEKAAVTTRPSCSSK